MGLLHDGDSLLFEGDSLIFSDNPSRCDCCNDDGSECRGCGCPGANCELFIRWSIWINNSRIAMPQFNDMTSISGTSIGFNAQTSTFDLETGFTATLEAPDFLTDCEPGILVTGTLSVEFEPSTDGVFENSRIFSGTLPQLGTNLGGEAFSRTDTFILQPDGAPTGSYLTGAVYQLPVTNFTGTNVVDVSFGYSSCDS